MRSGREAAETFINEDPEVGEGARLGVKLEYVTNQAEAFASDCDILVTNYERVRNNEFDFGDFTAVWLDEGNQSDQKKFIGNSVVPHVVKSWTEAMAQRIINNKKNKVA